MYGYSCITEKLSISENKFERTIIKIVIEIIEQKDGFQVLVTSPKVYFYTTII